MLSREEFHLKQKVEPFIHYREKHTTFECITRDNIEAVAAKVRCRFTDIKGLLRRSTSMNNKISIDPSEQSRKKP